MADTFSASRRLLTALRLSALGIDRPSAPSPGAAVRAAFAMQAQDFLGSLWSVGLRTPGATAASVEAAHDAGDFVRSWPMRGTLHFVGGEDLGWMLGLTGARMIQSAAGRRRQLGLTDDDFSRAASIVRDLLSGGGSASRAQLLAAFEGAGISTAGQRGVHILGQLAQLGILVLGARDGWMLLHERVPQPRRLEPPEALREFALRYFSAHGPATVRDFAWWSSLTLTDARAGLAAAREQLDEVDVEGVTYHHRPGLQPAGGDVHLLPGFDEYLLGYTDRSAALTRERSATIVPGGNGMFLSTVVVDGEVVGTWKRDRKARRVVVTVYPFTSLSASRMKGVRTELARYSEFLGTEVELTPPAGDRAT